MKLYLVLPPYLIEPMRKLYGDAVDYYEQEMIPVRTPEGYEKDDIDKYLASIGAWVHKTYTGGFGPTGAPDRIACIDGMFWGIEVKRQGKKPTPRQLDRMKAIHEAGGCAVAGTAAVVIEEIERWRART